MPLLNAPYCYLMHDVMDHSGLYTKNKIFKLDGIWADVVFTNQKAIKINKDGSSSVIKSNSE